MKKYRIIGDKTGKTVDIDHLEGLMQSDQKIALIKELRACSGLGLKDSKDIVEKYRSPIGWDYDGLISEFKVYLEIADPITKEEFLNIIEDSIDTMHTFHFTDMLEAVHTFM